MKSEKTEGKKRAAKKGLGKNRILNGRKGGNRYIKKKTEVWYACMYECMRVYACVPME